MSNINIEKCRTCKVLLGPSICNYPGINFDFDWLNSLNEDRPLTVGERQRIVNFYSAIRRVKGLCVVAQTSSEELNL